MPRLKQFGYLVSSVGALWRKLQRELQCKRGPHSSLGVRACTLTARTSVASGGSCGRRSQAYAAAAPNP